MGKKLIFSKEMIVNSAFELFKENGIDSITARGVAKYLNSSPVPIYSSIGSMDELKKILIHKAKELFIDYIQRDYTGLKFCDIAMGAVVFAREESQLYINVFLKEKSTPNILEEFIKLTLVEAQKDKRLKHLNEEELKKLFLDCWIYVHGLAALVATNYIDNPTNEYIENKIMNNPGKIFYGALEK